MRKTTLNVTEMVRNFSEYINRISYKHERFILLKGKKPVAELKPLPSGRKMGEIPGLLACLPTLTESEAEDFSADITRARTSLGKEGLKDPWDS